MRPIAGTIPILKVNQPAPEDRERLLAGLEAFANLCQSPDGYGSFAKQWPTFFPVEISYGGGGHRVSGKLVWSKNDVLQWAPEAQDLVVAYSWLLQHIWSSDADALNYTGVLLGTDADVLNRVHEGESGNGPIEDRFSAAWKSLHSAYADAYISYLPRVFASWKSGEFRYQPDNEFQQAVYLLFRESWRAKICAECSRCFVADKPAQLYCSTRCSGSAKKRHGLDWWRRTGATKRREDTQRSKATNATRKRTEGRK